MDADFPAAHSMDTSWYAVDQKGNVGLFHTNEGGAVPNDAYSPVDPEDFPPEVRAEVGNPIPADQLPEEKHLFVYECQAEGPTGPYERTQAPRKPLHIDQLPPRVRDAIRSLRFDTLDFRQTREFQPVELTPCSAWDPAYLASDGKTIKPIPGWEDDYAKFYKEYGAELAADGFIVEEPPKKKRSSRRKKKGDTDG
jgi:hypothetical protein